MKYFLLFLSTTMFFPSCTKKVKLFENHGVITGMNLLQCPCTQSCPCGCGGLFFHFTDAADTSNIIIDNPIIFKLPAGSRFPVYVTVQWQNTSRCNTAAIKVVSYKIL